MNGKTFLELFGFDHPPARLSEAVVIIIDMQREYLDGAVPLPGLADAAAGVARLIARAHAHGVPVIHVMNRGPKGNLLFNDEGPFYAELDGVEASMDEPVVIKHLPNAFAGTELREIIDRTGRKQLVIAGCTTHVCVSATVRAAVDLGYQVTVIADATTSRDLLDHRSGRLTAEVVKQVALAELRDAVSAVVESVDELAF